MGEANTTHISGQEFRVQRLHVILLHALAFALIMAVFAAKAALYIHAGNGKDDHLVARFFRAFFKSADHIGSRTIWMWAAVQNQNFHDDLHSYSASSMILPSSVRAKCLKKSQAYRALQLC